MAGSKAGPGRKTQFKGNRSLLISVPTLHKAYIAYEFCSFSLKILVPTISHSMGRVVTVPSAVVEGLAGGGRMSMGLAFDRKALPAGV